MKKEINIEIGGRIRSKREELGMTRELLAERAQISTPFLADVELGRKGISPSTVSKLCDAMHVTADYLILGREQGEFPRITGLLSGLDERYLPPLEQIVRAYVEAVGEKE